MARGSLADVAYERMLAWIMDGTLSAGAAVPLEETARTLRISPTPLREALARLEGQGLVVRSPMRGFRVAAPLSSQDLLDLTLAREVIEPEVAALAATAAGVTDVEVLREACRHAAEVEAGSRFDTYREYLQASAQFHDLVAQIAGNRYLQSAVAALPSHVQRFRLFGDHGVDDREVSLVEHGEIVDAIAAGDPEAARDAMRRHVAAVGRRSGANARSAGQ